MGIANFLAKITGVDKEVAWIQGKVITALDNSWMGCHKIYVDSNFNIALFLFKLDNTVHIFSGDISNSNYQRKYSQDGILVVERKLESKVLQWKIRPKECIYRGDIVTMNGSRMIFAPVLKDESFGGEITGEWIENKSREFIKLMKSGELWSDLVNKR